MLQVVLDSLYVIQVFCLIFVENTTIMRIFPIILSVLAILFVCTASINIQSANNSFPELMNEDFKHIFQIDNNMSDAEIKRAEVFLREYDSAININRSEAKTNGKMGLEIKSGIASCESDNFETALVIIKKDNSCECSIRELGDS